MIIERSAFAGLGKFGSRWLGDNHATVDYMGASVTGIMMHNILGIPLAGADICGFLGNTTAELCARWHILGGFYPFSRNHNTLGASPQEPWVWEHEFYDKGSTTYMAIMKRGIQTKYHMIRYYYTQMSLMSTGEEATLFKPHFFEFPNDKGAYNDQENNIMLGSALKLSVLTNALGVDEYDFYFASGRWCNVFNDKLGEASCFESNPGNPTGSLKKLETKAYDFHVHLRAGHIIPYQDATELKAMTTADLQDQPVELHIHGMALAPDYSSYTASGYYVNDDGFSLDVTNKQNKYFTMFSWDQTTATISFTQSKTAHDYSDSKLCTFCVNKNDQLSKVKIYNAKLKNMNKQFRVTVSSAEGKDKDLGFIAKYEDASDRLVIDFTAINTFLPLLTQIKLTA